jgi:hypothetical protein
MKPVEKSFREVRENLGNNGPRDGVDRIPDPHAEY